MIQRSPERLGELSKVNWLVSGWDLNLGQLDQNAGCSFYGLRGQFLCSSSLMLSVALNNCFEITLEEVECRFEGFT